MPETRVPELQDSCYSIRLSVFTFTQISKSMAYIFAADSMGLSSFNFFVVGSERRILSAAECVSAVQSHPRSLILASKGRMRLPISH